MSDLVERLREPYTQDQSRRVAEELLAADRIEELEGKLTACEKALAHPIIQKVALAGGLIKPLQEPEAWPTS